MSDATTRGAATPRAWAVAPTVGLAAFMEVLDISIANVALQHIAGALSASQDESTWVLTAYLVTNAVVLPMSGWLATTLGRKRFFMASIAGFSASSLLCGLAPSLPLLILCRGLQGATGGGLQPTAQAILADTFPPEKRGLAFAAYGLAVVFAPAIGPTLGGYITDNFTWRWVFLINVPVGLVLLPLVQRMLSDPPALERERRARRERGLGFDYAGFAALAIGMCALQIVLDKGQEDDWFASRFIAVLAVTAVVSLAFFALWEWRREDPIVDLRLLGNRNFALGNALMLMLGFVLLGTTVLLPQFVQTLLGYTATQAGLVISPGGFALMVAMPVVGAIVNRVDPRWLIGLGLVINAAALLHMGGFDRDIDYRTVALARTYQALGLAFLFIPINTVAFFGVTPEQSSNASAIINMTRNIGGSFGISVATTLLARRAQVHQSVLVQHVTPESPAYQATVANLQQQFMAHAASAADALQQAQAAVYQTVRTQAQLLSFIDDFRLMAFAFLVLVPCLFFLRRPRAGAAHPPGA